MKRVYLYLQDGRYSCYADISDEVELPPYSTLTMPPETMTNPYWINGQWINKEQTPDKVPNYQEVLDPLPTTQQKIMMQQSQQITVLQTLIMQQNQLNAKSQATNQQQAKQIEQLQQMFMLANQQQAVADKKGEN
ncbi:hypothetical protein LMB76_07580 [Limosilactobacillus reuteri]|uniref:Uncharacterized protein n=1 Tax=Limosilactobacillus reuteri TaxID=1598 RepID=A0AAW4X6K7_LIMRT|nr:hypothetical protein [Limosilactobacillus reuteri]MCC4478075.1 hypothetical protein [Limosilactobacillus reuteri]MCC4479150.1 hypothetical protein [Limosilactobacillus reuteri]MCC4489715.1 hypothetical protein [Limosilactobacillus reuteri]MCC4494029.1 hypothetical protein [Limosilactobacillus reuteri]MCC4496401.1 hypothetical protein [Limosilactobacillus reuteri]